MTELERMQQQRDCARAVTAHYLTQVREMEQQLSSTRAQLAEVTRVATRGLTSTGLALRAFAYTYSDKGMEQDADEADAAIAKINLLSQQHEADHG